MNRRIKVLYIAGCDRSGSTLIARILGRVEGFFSAGEVWHIFGRGMANNELCGCGSHFRECEVWSRVLKHYEEEEQEYAPSQIDAIERNIIRLRYLPVWMLSLKPKALTRQLEVFTRYTARIYSAIHQVTGCRVIVDSSKNPAYAYVLSGIPNIELYVIHLIRDSRGVAYSWSKIKRRPEIPWRIEYMDRHKSPRSSIFWTAAQLGAEILKYKQHYLRIRYEDFIREPLETTLDVLDFLGEGDAAVDHIREDSITLGIDHTISGNPMRMKKDIISLKLDSEWLSAMKRVDKFIVTLLTLPLLVKYDYIPKRSIE